MNNRKRRSIALGAAARLARWTVRQTAEVAERDPNAEIDIDFSHRVAEILEGEIGIAAGIDDDDQPAAPPHHFVETEIFEMTAVGQIDVGTVVVGQAERFREQRLDGPFRTFGRVSVLAGFSGITEPPA